MHYEGDAVLIIKGISLTGSLFLDFVEDDITQSTPTFEQPYGISKVGIIGSGSGFFFPDDLKAVPKLDPLVDSDLLCTLEFDEDGKHRTPSVRICASDRPGTLGIELY
jgi:hypothetical protein